MVSDVVIVETGIVGAACAWQRARAGLSTVVIDRGPISGGAATEFLFGRGMTSVRPLLFPARLENLEKSSVSAE